jgi:hypothetical protein
MMRSRGKLASVFVAAALAALCGCRTWGSPTTVYSQNTAPGDLFSNSGPANQGSSFGHPNWVYNNTRGGGSVGIRTDFPRSGNGSVYFNSPSNTGKADIEYFADPVNAGGNFFPNPFNPASILGPLSDLSRSELRMVPRWRVHCTRTPAPCSAPRHPAGELGQQYCAWLSHL